MSSFLAGCDRRVGVDVVNADAMTYLVQRNDRFYVVAYDGLDPLTGKERRRWHPIGIDRKEAEEVAARLHSERVSPAPTCGGPITIGDFLLKTWLPQKRGRVRATTAYRYAWFVERVINPAIGTIPLARLRADHLDGLYESLATTGGRGGIGLAPKTIHEVHMIIRAGLDLAVNRGLVVHNIAHDSHARPGRRVPAAARAWNVEELRAFLAAASGHRLYPALHLAAHTGMRRGEIVGLKWSDLNPAGRPLNPDSLSEMFDRIVRTNQLPHISIHGLRHTHASLLVAAGTPIKVVSERLEHAHPGFTMATYQHLLPGMSAAAAQQFADLVAAPCR
jgi:integrase